MPVIENILDIIREFAPEDKTAPNYEDNVGLIVGSFKGETDKVLCCLDVTLDVIEEAVELGAGLIVSHHPPIYYPLKKVVEDEVTGKKIIKAIENKIALYAAHTNLDYTSGGLNDYAAEAIGLNNVTKLNCNGIGRIGELKEPAMLTEFINRLKIIFEDQNIRVVAKRCGPIKNVAIINGGGGDLENVVMSVKMGADCLITSDIKYHVALYASGLSLTLIEPNHYATEQIYIKRFVELMNKKAESSGISVEFIASKVERSPYIAIK